MMKTAVMIVLSALGIGAFAGEEVKETRNAVADGLVNIINVRGDVEVVGWDRDEIRIEGELDDRAEELLFEVKGNRARIEVVLPRGSNNWGDGSDLVISVPLMSRVDFEGVSTDLKVEDIKGGLRAKVVSGDVWVSGIANQIILNTVSGEIEVEDSEGERLAFSTVSGEIEADVRGDSISFDAVSGDIEARMGPFSDLTAQSISGDIDLDGELLGNGRIDVSSVSADIRLVLKDPVHADVRIETGPGGDIDNRISAAAPEKSMIGSRKLKTVLGNGSGMINMKTVSGDIRIASDD